MQEQVQQRGQFSWRALRAGAGRAGGSGQADMTRDEFIVGYMTRSGLPVSARTQDGFSLDGFRRSAIPCYCGEQECRGWQMTNPDDPMTTRAELVAAARAW